MCIRHLFLFSVCLNLLFVSAGKGQEPDTTQLPEIAPREIEIRGERQIALPSLERQPLSGFSSPPRIPEVPSDRRPYVEPYYQELDDLPQSLPLPQTIVQSMAPDPTPQRGFVEGGGGRYYNRFFEGRLSLPVSSNEHLSVHGEYTGTEGFTPFERDSIDTPSDVAKAEIRFESTRDPLQVTLNLHGAAEQYTLYGVTPPSDEANREGYSVGSALRLQGYGSVPGTIKARYDQTKYRTSLPDLRAGESANFRHRRLSVGGSVTAPMSLRPHLEASYNRSWFGGDPSATTGWSGDAAGTLSFSRSDPSFLEIGVRGLGFRSPVDLSTDTTDPVERMYVAPEVNAEWQVTNSLTAHLRNRPRLRAASLYRVYGDHPYVVHAPSLRPTVETINAETGISIAAGPIRVDAAAGYRYAPSYPFYEPGRQGGYTGGIYEIHYGTARILRARGQISLQGVPGTQASLSVAVREGMLENGETIIPNFAPVTADAIFSISFDDGNGFLEVTSHFESSRYVSREEENRLDPYFDLDLEGSYAVSSIIELLARIENISAGNPTRWARYPRPPLQTTAGLRIRW